MTGERFLVTGGMGCLGAWVVRQLITEGVDVTTFDISDDDSRLRLVLEEAELADVRKLHGDLTDADQVLAAVAEATHVIHLGALQIPLVKARPTVGSAVNVTGTVNVFEAALASGLEHLVFTSSVAAYGPPGDYDADLLPATAARKPQTLYGAFKVANEDTAKVYWLDHGVASVGLRPHSVYGLARDQGVTSYPSVAILEAVRGREYHIGYDGTYAFHYAPDVARLLIDSARTESEGAEVYGIGGTVAPVSEFVNAIADATGFSGITFGGDPLPLPQGMDDSTLQARLGSFGYTPLGDAVAETAELFRQAIQDGRPLPEPPRY
jgi:UDP-glucuronate 4-epimerase